MAFTKKDAIEAKECAEAIMKGLPPKKAADFIGEFNTLLLFLGDAVRAAPEK